MTNRGGLGVSVRLCDDVHGYSSLLGGRVLDEMVDLFTDQRDLTAVLQVLLPDGRHLHEVALLGVALVVDGDQQVELSLGEGIIASMSDLDLQ